MLKIKNLYLVKKGAPILSRITHEIPSKKITVLLGESGPCRMLAPVLEQVSKDLKGKASLGKIDIDAEQKTASRFQITSVPTMILFKDGKEVNRLVGLRNAEAIKDFIMSAG